MGSLELIVVHLLSASISANRTRFLARQHRRGGTNAGAEHPIVAALRPSRMKLVGFFSLCDRPSLSEEDVMMTNRNFTMEPSGFESRPAKVGHQPEASVAWTSATAAAKRTQRACRPCD
jgi:hypothetical protein